jgi:RNA polymerase-binding transcription factor DksA
MPSSLDRSELERIRLSLVHKRTEVLRDRSPAGDLTLPQLPDPMDNLVAASARDVALHSINRRGLLLIQIDEALQRLARGACGFCAECRAPLTLNRIEALPWASLCLPCQQSADARLSPVREPVNPAFEDAA